MADDLFESVAAVIRDILEQPDVSITETTAAGDIEGWDSFKQIEILITLESEFGIKFTSAEMDSLKNVGDLVAVVRRKRQG